MTWFGRRSRNLYALRAQVWTAVVLSVSQYDATAPAPGSYEVLNRKYLDQPGLVLALRAEQPGLESIVA